MDLESAENFGHRVHRFHRGFYCNTEESAENCKNKDLRIERIRRAGDADAFSALGL